MDPVVLHLLTDRVALLHVHQESSDGFILKLCGDRRVHRIPRRGIDDAAGLFQCRVDRRIAELRQVVAAVAGVIRGQETDRVGNVRQMIPRQHEHVEIAGHQVGFDPRVVAGSDLDADSDLP